MKPKICISVSLAMAIMLSLLGYITESMAAPRSLNEAEMFMIKGAAKKDVQCIDMCSNVGDYGTCVFAGDCSDGNWNFCHSKYRETTTPDTSIMFCSSDQSAGEVECGDIGDQKECGSLEMCWCVDGSPSSDYCWNESMGTYRDKDECQ